MSSSIWLTVSEAATLTGVSERAIQLGFKRKKYSGRRVKGNGVGYGGMILEIALSSLPESAQVAYWDHVRRDAQPVETSPSPVADESLPDWKREDALRWTSILREWEAIYHATPEGQRTQVAEVFCADHGIAVGTLYRRWNRWKKHPQNRLAGVASRAHKNRGRRLSITDDMAAYIVRQHCRPQQPPIQHTYESLVEYCQRTGHRPPSQTSVRRYVSEIPSAVQAFFRIGGRAYATKYGYYSERDLNYLPVNAIWVSDHRQFDVMVVDDEGSGDIIRPWLTAHMDLRSRYITGYHIATSPNSRTIALATYDALTSLGEFQNGLVRGFSPRVLYMDDGKDYRSAFLHGATWSWSKIRVAPDEELKGFLPSLDIEPMHAIPYNPQSKPIEPFFRNIGWSFERYQPGWCGNKPENKPEKLARELQNPDKLLTLSRLRDLFAAEFLPGYHGSEHNGIGGASPESVFRAGAEPVEMSARALDILLMPSTRPITVYRNGVRPLGQGVNFWHDDMGALVGSRVICRWDPADISRVHVFTPPPDNRYLCTADNIPLMRMGETTEEEFKAAARRKKAARKTVENWYEINTAALSIEDALAVEKRNKKTKPQEELRQAVGSDLTPTRRISQADAMAESMDTPTPRRKPTLSMPEMSLSERLDIAERIVRERQHQENPND